MLLFVVPVRGEDKSTLAFSGESRAAALRLTAARKLQDDRKWSEAIEELQSILNSAGNDLVSIGPSHSVRAGRLCQVELASLPAEALRLYRQRYENQASKKLQQAQTERDIPQLRKLVEDAFCTRAAEKAIDLLGDLAFERGRFDEAEEWWRILAPLPDAGRSAEPQRKHGTLVYPDPGLDPARVQAKQLLARLFQDADDDWPAALESYRHRHAKAEGTLAGRKGRYTDLLQALADEMHQGNSGRGHERALGKCDSADILDNLSALCREGPTWTFDLENRKRQAEAGVSPAVSAEQARTLAFDPVIAGQRVLIADARYVTAYDLRNGQSETWYDVARNNGGVSPNLKLPAPPDLRYTLTVADGHAYARLGAQDIGNEAPPPRRIGPPMPRREKETFLACLNLQPDAKGEHFRWQIRGIAQDNALFEGAPLVAEGLIWIATTRYNGNRCITAIDCYTADDSSEPPLRWRCDVCETSNFKAGQPRYRHPRLTLAGTQIIYCTHSGAVVSIDALTGRRNWAIRYPRRKSETEEVELRDQTPALFAAGRLYVAPADSDTLLCLDPASGRTLWEVQPRRVVHLLGVGQGRLIFTTPSGLRAVRADNGEFAWAVPDSGALTPAGRGVLLGDLVLFPTTQIRDADSPWRQAVVYVLRQSDGRAADDPARLHRLPAGNLAFANGILAVADQRTLSVFVPPRMLLGQHKAEALRHPNSTAALLQLARAETDAAHDEAALQTLHRLETLLSEQSKTSTAKKARRQSLNAKQDLLLTMAQRAAGDKRFQDAQSALDSAAAIPLPPRYRLHALLRAAEIWQDARQTDRADAVRESIRSDKSLCDVPMRDRQGRPVAVRLAASRRRARGVPAPAYGSRLNEKSSLPLFRSWHVRLESNEWMLAGWRECDPDLLLTGSPDGRFICRLASTGEIRWTHRLPFAPSWAGCCADTILAAGADGVACLHRENGQLLWHFPAPASDLYPHACREELRVVLDPQPAEPLSDFRLAAGRLFFLQGQRRLFALEAGSGAVLWDRWTPDGPLYLPFPHGCFSACFHANSETVLIQMSGRRWLLKAATGRPIHEAVASRDLWQRTPLQLNEHSVCVTPDSRSIALLDTRTGQCRWTHRFSGTTTRSGELPSVLESGDFLLCVQPANIGYFLQRLDRSNGEAVWPRPPLLTARTLDLSTWAADAEAVYGIEDHELIARSQADGAILWRRPLSGGRWQARRVGDYLAVWPQALASETRFRFRSLLGTVQWQLGSLLAPEAVFPMSYYDPKTGHLVQRLHFRIETPIRTALAKRRRQQDGARAWIARTSSLLASEDGPVIRLDAPNPFAAIGGEAWGLMEMKSNFTTEYTESTEKRQ